MSSSSQNQEQNPLNNYMEYGIILNLDEIQSIFKQEFSFTILSKVLKNPNIVISTRDFNNYIGIII